MDLVVLTFGVLLLLFFMLLGLTRTAPLITIFAGIIGIFAFVNLMLDDGKITYWSGGTTVTITLGTYGVGIFVLPIIMCFIMAMVQKQ